MNPVRILVPRFRHLDAEFQARDAFAAMSAGDRDLARLERLNCNWAKALAFDGHYARLASRHHLPPRFCSLEEFKDLVPITRREDVCADPAAFKLPDQSGGTWDYSSGSTGDPVRVFWSNRGRLESLRDQYWARSWWGVDPFDRQALLWGHAVLLGSCWQKTWERSSQLVLDRLRGRRRFNAHCLDASSLRASYDAIARFRPVSLYAFASYAHLLALANRDRPGPRLRLKAAFLTSERILPSHRESIREVFDCACVGEYGSVDCGLIAHEEESRGYRVFERSVLVETLPHETGYSIYITPLLDTGFPLFRYETGDATPAPLARDAAGQEILGEVAGRDHDVIRSSSGIPYQGMEFELIVEQLPEVAMFKVIQRCDLSLEILVQTKSGQDLPPHRAALIRRKTACLVGDDVPIVVRSVERIERSPAGKHRFVLSEYS